MIRSNRVPQINAYVVASYLGAARDYYIKINHVEHIK